MLSERGCSTLSDITNSRIVCFKGHYCERKGQVNDLEYFKLQEGIPKDVGTLSETLEDHLV